MGFNAKFKEDLLEIEQREKKKKDRDRNASMHHQN